MRTLRFGTSVSMLLLAGLPAAAYAGEMAPRSTVQPDPPAQSNAAGDRLTREQREDIIRRKEEVQERTADEAQRRAGEAERQRRRR